MNLNTLLENSSDAILVLNREWQVLEVNPSAERLFRRKRADFCGKHFWSEYPDLSGTPAETAMLLCQQSQRPQRFEQFIPGLYAWHSVLAVPGPDEIVLFCRDISDRVRALRDDAVREGMRSIVENVPVAITITRGPEHRIDLQNVMSRQLLNGRNVEVGSPGTELEFAL